MKILAIRGENLASLAEPFAVELDASPLSGAGLFAITGPTGSGKSTLLDAMCVALFDATPRLNAKSTALVGREGQDAALRVGMTDVRSLLRRGSGSGWAQVDFLGVDGGRYRATWRVHRARNRADGRLQAQHVELQDLSDGRVIGGTKTQTLAAISQRLGLSFEQFRRSALLAQGDFSAFLTAPSQERAELLERMTGTEIYSEVSKAAFARSRWEKEQLEALERTAASPALLAPHEVERCEQELAAARSEASEATALVEGWQALVVYQAQDAALTADLAHAHEAVTAARNACAEVLGEWERAELTTALPQVAEHRARVEEARRLQEGAATKLSSLSREVVAASKREAQLEAEQEAHERARAAAGRMLDAAPWLALLAANWLGVDAELRRAAEALDQQGQLDAARGALLDALEAAEKGLAGARDAAAEAQGVQEARQRSLASVCTVSAGEAAAGQVRAAERLQLLDEVLVHATALEKLWVDHEVALDESAAAITEADQATSAGAETRLTLTHLQIRLEEADRAHAELIVPARFDEQRGLLREGEACPLCGSPEHPWADEAHRSLAAALEKRAARVAELRAQGVALERELATLLETRRQAREKATKAAERAERDEQGIATEMTRYAALRAEALQAGLGLELPPEPERATVEEQRFHWRAVASAHEALMDAQRATEGARQSVLEAELAVKEPSQAVSSNDHARQALTKAITERLEELSVTLASVDGWPMGFRSAPEAWRRHVKEQVEAYQSCVADAGQAAQALSELALLLREVQTARTGLEEQRAAARASLAEAEARLEVLDATLETLTRGLGASGLLTLEARVVAAEGALGAAEAVARERRQQLERHRTKAPDRPAVERQPAEAEPVELLALAKATEDQARARVERVRARLEAHHEAVGASAAQAVALQARRESARPWIALGELIGHHSGKSFQKFAQSLTLDLLVHHANGHLVDLAPRYQLMRIPGYDLDLQVIDRDLGDDVRTIRSLSGGETFLVSLALALSLSSVSSASTHVQTLFIDEGFGTLDPRSLEMALAALDTLQATGCKVGVISHVPGLAERIGVQVVVEPQGAARSVLTVV